MRFIAVCSVWARDNDSTLHKRMRLSVSRRRDTYNTERDQIDILKPRLQGITAFIRLLILPNGLVCERCWMGRAAIARFALRLLLCCCTRLASQKLLTYQTEAVSDCITVRIFGDAYDLRGRTPYNGGHKKYSGFQLHDVGTHTHVGKPGTAGGKHVAGVSRSRAF